MPLYLYHCRRCEVRTEVLQRQFGAPSDVTCEACGSEDVERVLSAFATNRSELDRLRALDPKYYARVDRAMANTRDSDPMRHLNRLIPFDSAREAGGPIKF
jgi:putative FmdB family regulatory protein